LRAATDCTPDCTPRTPSTVTASSLAQIDIL
jgi:hypothetical protein